MMEDEALDALLRSAQRTLSPSEDDLRDGAALAERLGGLALALIQAGVYCFQKTQMANNSEVPFTFRQYMEEMDGNQAELMKYSAVQSLDRYEKSVYAALNMSYSALPQLTRDFLHFCGFFHHSNIPLLMLESAVEHQFQQRPRLLPSEIDVPVESKLAALLQVPGKSTTIHLHKIIFSLKMFSLVVTSMSPNSVMLNYHMLVFSWSRDLAPEKELCSSMATRVLSTCTDPKYYFLHRSLLPHIRETLERPIELGLNDMAAFAERLMEGGLAGESETIYRKMYDRCTREFGKEDVKTWSVLGNLASSISHQGRTEEAEKMEQKVLEGERRIYAEGSLRTFVSEMNLAVSYIHQGRWNEADTSLQKLLAVAKDKLGNEHSYTLQAMHNLATLYFKQDRDLEGMVIEEEVLEIRRRVLGKDHPDTLKSINSLASLCAALNRFDDAERLGEETVEIMTRMNGKDHPDTLTAMSNLAVTYQVRGKLGDAVTLADQALEGFKRVLGKSHPEALRTMYVLADMYFEIGNLSDGIQLQEELHRLEGVGGTFSTFLLESLTKRGWA